MPTPITTIMQTFNPFTVAGVSVSVLEGEEHQRTAQMTEQVCETGRVISDHIILKPRSVTLRFEQSNSGSSSASAVRQVFNAMEAIWTNRTPITLNTLHFPYADMVCTSLSSLHKAPNKWTLKFTASFSQINEVNTGFSAISVKQMANPTQAPAYLSGMHGVPYLPTYQNLGTSGVQTFAQWVSANATPTKTQ